MRPKRKARLRKRARARGAPAGEHSYLERLLAGMEAGAPVWVGELVAAGKIGEGERSEWLEPIQLAVRSVRDCLERGNPVGAAVAMHYAQLYVSGLTCMRREIDARIYQASEDAKKRASKFKDRDRRLLLERTRLKDKGTSPGQILEELGMIFRRKSSTIERRLRRLDKAGA